MSAAHTPTPWQVANGSPLLIGCDGFWIAGMMGLQGEIGEANARFIVHAVNCHDEMLAALTLARTFMVDFEGLPETEADNPLRVVDAALAKTREIGK